jgi:hypothetical protein
MWKLWKRPTLATLLTGYALTLLAFLFFGRYFQGNYLGYILAVATPALFLRAEAMPVRKRVVRSRLTRAQRASAGATAPIARSAGTVVGGEARSPEPTGEPVAAPAPAGALD